MKKLYNIHTIWALLILLTLSTYFLGHIQASGTAIMLILIGTAFIKSILIIREFMELKGVSLLWKIIMYGWLTIICLAIVVAYLLA